MAVLRLLRNLNPARCCLVFVAMSVWLLSSATGSTPQTAPSKEYQVKAVFLYRFAEFVDWPQTAFSGSSFVIGVLGSDPFGSFLDDTVRGEVIGGHSFVVRRCKTVEEVAGCNAVFVSRSEDTRLSRELTALRGRSILTVSDLDDFGKRGGMIQFVVEDGKTRLLINVEAAKSAHLTISSKLLRRAEIVSEGGRLAVAIQ